MGPLRLNLLLLLLYTWQKYQRCCLSMNGCGGDPEKGLGMCETRTLPAVHTPAVALNQLNSAVAALKFNPPNSTSGIIRLEVPILEHIKAIRWLHAQWQLPRCFFSTRKGQSIIASQFFFDDSTTNEGNGTIECQNRTATTMVPPSLVSVAGVGAAVFFQGFRPFALGDWRCIRRFLSKDCPLIRAYGAIRFDARTNISAEWEGFGSFYFIIPQVEFDELEGSSMLVTNIAWDDTLLWSWEKAVDVLQATLCQISIFTEAEKDVPRTLILSKNHVPTKASWDVSVKKALQMIETRTSGLDKVVLARSSRVVTDIDIDPIELLAHLQVEGQNAFQFCVQPPNAPAFIGNTVCQIGSYIIYCHFVSADLVYSEGPLARLYVYLH